MKARVLLSVLLGVVVVASAGCRAGSANVPGDRPSSAPPVVEDGQWQLRVDRAWDGQSEDMRYPTDELSETSFSPVSSGPSYRVVISRRGTHVSIQGASIGDRPFEGRRAATVEDRLVYDLDEGTFAGGRFAAWSTEAGLQGELTVFGSGRPIAKSERGVLVRAP